MKRGNACILLVAGFVLAVNSPNSLSNTVSVIDPRTFRVIATFPVGKSPQPVVPSYDLRILRVNNNITWTSPGTEGTSASPASSAGIFSG